MFYLSKNILVVVRGALLIYAQKSHYHIDFASKAVMIKNLKPALRFFSCCSATEPQSPQ
jgi:hypothetical protein